MLETHLMDAAVPEDRESVCAIREEQSKTKPRIVGTRAVTILSLLYSSRAHYLRRQIDCSMKKRIFLSLSQSNPPLVFAIELTSRASHKTMSHQTLQKVVLRDGRQSESLYAQFPQVRRSDEQNGLKEPRAK